MKQQLKFRFSPKGGLHFGSLFASAFGPMHGEINSNGKGQFTMRGVYEKVKGSKDFYIYYTDAAGRRHREQVGRYSAAVEALINRRREVREGRFIPPTTPVDRITFGDLADKYMKFKSLRCAANTVAGNLRLLRRLKLMFGKSPARDVTTSAVDEVLLKLKYTGNRVPVADRAGKITRRGGATKTAGEVSGPTLNAYRSLIYSVFRYGIANRHVTVNPVAETQAFEKHEGVVRYLTADEEASLRGVIRQDYPQFEPELDLALHTGLRRHEQRKLTWDKIDLDRGILTVPSDTKTGRRFIPINSACREAILKLHAQSKGSEYVCPHRGANTNNIWMRGWLKRAGVMNFRPAHDLRHTFASRLVMAGVGLRTVGEFLGHTSAETTMIYAHLSPEHGKAAIEKLVAQPAAPAAVAVKRPPRRAVRAQAQPAPKIARSA